MQKLILRKICGAEEAGAKVSTIGIGDVDGDGELELITGAELFDTKTTIQVRGYDGDVIQELGAFNYRIDAIHCADIDSDGFDEILLGDDDGTLYIYKFDGVDNEFEEMGKLSLSRDKIRSIKTTECYNKKLIVVGAKDGSLGLFFWDEGKLEPLIEHKRRIAIGFPIYSVLPVLLHNKLKILIGGEGYIGSWDVEKLELDMIIKLDKEERIYDISLIQIFEDSLRVICATRNGKPIFLDLKEDGFSFPENFPYELSEWNGRSIYSICLFDVDNDKHNEIIIAGKAKDGEGCIEIYKFNENGYWAILSNEILQNEIYSIIPSEKEKVTSIFLSMGHHPFVKYEISTSKRVKDTIRRLGRDILERRGKYVFFIGAGISFPAFRLADQVRDSIMEENGINPGDLKAFLRESEQFNNYFENGTGISIEGRIPLEFVLYYIKNHAHVEKMREMIKKHYSGDSDIPPGIQILVDEFLKKEYVNIIFSVNYDTLIEDRMGNEPNFNIIIDDKDYKSIDICNNKSLIKLHGTITKPDSIEGAIDEVTDLKPIKKLFLKFIFTGHKIIFVGYSGRDFDIYPCLEDIVSKCKTDCYFVDPNDHPNKKVDTIIKSSGGDVSARYFPIKSDEFFEILKEGLNDGNNKEANEVI